MEVTDKVSWNLSEQLIFSIASVLNQATRAYLQGQIEKAFNAMRGVRQRIIQSLDSGEREQAFDLEAEFNYNFYDPVTQKKDYFEFRKKQYEVYERYNTLVMDFLEKYGYTIRKREDNTRINV